MLVILIILFALTAEFKQYYNLIWVVDFLRESFEYAGNIWYKILGVCITLAGLYTLYISLQDYLNAEFVNQILEMIKSYTERMHAYITELVEKLLKALA